MSNDPPERAAHPTGAPIEVLERVRAVRIACELMLDGRINPTPHVLGATIAILTKAMQWQAGHPPSDLQALEP